MHGITIMYDYDGDEHHWEKVTSGFIKAIDGDSEIAGKFHYRVNKAKEGNRRIHWGWWDTPETLAKLQSRDYFKTFSAHVREMAGGQPTNIAVTKHAATSG